MESKNEISKELKEGHWYKNSKTDKPIMIETDLFDLALVIEFSTDANSAIYGSFTKECFICDKKYIVPLEVNEGNLIRFGFIFNKVSFISQIKTFGKVSVNLGPKSYIIKETDKGIHEIQERYNLQLNLRR